MGRTFAGLYGTSLFTSQNAVSLIFCVQGFIVIERIILSGKYASMLIRSLILTFIVVLFTLPATSNTTYFTYNSQTGNSATIGLPLSANPNVDGQPLEPRDEIGVFTPDGLCVGGTVWNGETNVGITVWGNNTFTQEIDGIRPGEEIHYRVWIRATDTEVKVVDVEYLLGDGIYQPNGIFQIESFTAYKPPQEPRGVYPEDNASGISLSVQFVWERVQSADSYSLQLSPEPDFSILIVDEDEITDTSYAVTGLQLNTQYFWRVRARGYGGESDWSQPFAFTTLEQIDIRSIPLSANWNMISSNINPADPGIKNIFKDVQNNSLFVKDGSGKVYWPENDIYDIDEWNITETYWVYVDSPDTVQFTGTRISPADVQFDLIKGWNFPAYLYDEPWPIQSVLAPIRHQMELVKTHNGLIYWPDYFIDTIGELQPGQGYQIYMNEDAQFVYPALDEQIANKVIQSSTGAADRRATPDRYMPNYTNTGESAVLLVEAAFARNGDEIAVWDSAGILVGAGVVHNRRAAVTVWGNNSRTEDVKDGALNREPLSLTVWSSDEDVEYSLTVTRIVDVIADTIQSGELQYGADGIYIAGTERDRRITGFPTNYTLYQNYPNPFNPGTTLRYSIPQDSYVRLAVYNVLGQKVAELVNEEKKAGVHRVQFDAGNLSSGVYLYRLEVGFYVETKRMLLIR